MRLLIATDAWQPQVNGVVRTLGALSRRLRGLGATVSFVTPEGFPSFPVPTYPDLRCALPSRREIVRRIEDAKPDAIHIATEGTIGHAVRAYCLREGRPFTTAYMTRFPEYVSARVPIPECWSYALLRRFHSAATVTMVSTTSLMAELTERRFRNIGLWTRGVDTDLFKPAPAADLNLPRPIFMSVGRVAVEKNLEAFLSLPLPGSKVVIGTGPQEAELRRRFPETNVSGAARRRRARGPYRGGRCVRVSQQDRHIRHRAIGGARLWRSGRGLSGDRSARCDQRPSGRRSARRSRDCLHGGLAGFASGLPGLCADALMGHERASVPRSRQSNFAS